MSLTRFFLLHCNIAQVGQDVRDVCRESGFDGFLAKPADRDAIQAELERLAGASTRTAVAVIPSKPISFGGSAETLAIEKQVTAGLDGVVGIDEGSFLSHGAFDFDTPRPDF